jgi:Type I phosphodiesterase / nucleotide pyrophosphatase
MIRTMQLLPRWKLKSSAKLDLFLAVLIFPIFILMAAAPAPAFAAEVRNRSRLVILMVWDGLRPDAVTPTATPNLFALTRGGVYFAAHHALYPSLTMVNAAGLATGAASGANGIVANTMYLAHLLGTGTPQATDPLATARTMPVSLENSLLLEALGAGHEVHLVEVETVAQQLLHKGGFVGIVGKSGPTFLFDDRAGTQDLDPKREIFVSDDEVRPQSLTQQLGPGLSRAALIAALRSTPPLGKQDEHLTELFIDHVVPPAAAALGANRPALLVLWQHNPDITEHAAGLGTAAYDQALSICDANLGRVRAAIAKLGLEDRTDLLVLSDHGFTTIKMRVALADLLVAQGLKKSKTSDDVVVAHNFGSDEIYLSPQFDRAARADLTHKIVRYAAAQEWCGPIFSRPTAARGDHGYRGEIEGTFDQAWFGLLNPARSPDLIISFRELNEDNSKLTGQPMAPLLDGAGVHNEPNHSQPLIHPMMGVTYADCGTKLTAGNGTHGSLGEYDMHNFGAAAGPDFRRAYVDQAPTSNIDVARTIGVLLGIQGAAAASPPPAARLVKEALRNGSSPAAYRRLALSVTLNLPDRLVVTTVEVDQLGPDRYPIGATVRHIPAAQKASVSAGRSPSK